jgi:hypothetical protein
MRSMCDRRNPLVHSSWPIPVAFWFSVAITSSLLASYLHLDESKAKQIKLKEEDRESSVEVACGK